MTHLNSNLADVNVERTSGPHVVAGTSDEEARASKPADTVYRIAAMVGALILLFTVVWAG
jgi:hypothetical protein